MKKFKFSISADLFFIFIAVFFVFYAIFINNGVKIFLCIILSVLSALLVSAIIAVLLILINDKKGVSALVNSETEQLVNELVFLKREKLLELFSNYFKKDGLFTEIFDNGILIKDKNAFVYPIFKYENITTEDIIKAYQKAQENTLIILGNTYTSESLSLVKSPSLNIKLFNISNVYYSLKKADCMPPFTLKIKPEKSKFLSVLKGLFNKKHAKFFFISGIITLFLSTVTFLSTYYMVWGVIFLIASATCKFFAPATQKTNGINL